VPNPTRLRWERWDLCAGLSLSGHRGTVTGLGSSLNINQSLAIKAGSRATRFLFCVFYPNIPLTRNVGSSRQRGSTRQGAPEQKQAAEAEAPAGSGRLPQLLPKPCRTGDGGKTPLASHPRLPGARPGSDTLLFLFFLFVPRTLGTSRPQCSV